MKPNVRNIAQFQHLRCMEEENETFRELLISWMKLTENDWLDEKRYRLLHDTKHALAKDCD